MENTTATLHTDALQQDARQLTDGNKYEDYIAHELFHQWFGDLVTTESWSNLTLNESFANFSETLWFEYKHGKDAGDATNFHDIEKYLADSGQPVEKPGPVLLCRPGSTCSIWLLIPREAAS